MDPAAPALPVPAFDSFASASRAVLEHLQAQFPMGLWMVTRTSGDDWIVLDAADERYGVGAGDLFRWSDSFCSRMVVGDGPTVAPDAEAVPAYAEAPIGRQVNIGAYVGVPLALADGELFGTLCAIDPDRQGDALTGAGDQAALLGKLLSTILDRELAADRQARQAEVSRRQAEVDALTGLPNRRAWESALEAEEVRCRRYGVPAAVCFVDLDGFKEINDRGGHEAGDEQLRVAARVLAETARSGDVVARVGGDEFAVLLLEADQDQAAAATERFDRALADAGVPGSVGAARRPARGTLADAVAEADAAMYATKRSRQAA